MHSIFGRTLSEFSFLFFLAKKYLTLYHPFVQDKCTRRLALFFHNMTRFCSCPLINCLNVTWLRSGGLLITISAHWISKQGCERKPMKNRISKVTFKFFFFFFFGQVVKTLHVFILQFACYWRWWLVVMTMIAWIINGGGEEVDGNSGNIVRGVNSD